MIKKGAVLNLGSSTSQEINLRTKMCSLHTTN